MKEKVKYIDESEIEVNIYHLGYRKASMIAEECLKLDNMTRHKNGDESLGGNFNMPLAQRQAMETIKDIDLDKLDSTEAGRIYQKYFEKEIMSAMGKGGNPN